MTFQLISFFLAEKRLLLNLPVPTLLKGFDGITCSDDYELSTEYLITLTGRTTSHWYLLPSKVGRPELRYYLLSHIAQDRVVQLRKFESFCSVVLWHYLFNQPASSIERKTTNNYPLHNELSWHKHNERHAITNARPWTGSALRRRWLRRHAKQKCNKYGALNLAAFLEQKLVQKTLCVPFVRNPLSAPVENNATDSISQAEKGFYQRAPSVECQTIRWVSLNWSTATTGRP